VVNVLRIQFERQKKGLFPSVAEYSRFYMMTQERLKIAKDDLLLLAPGPINRGVELTPEVADGRHSAILDQVANGLAIRMAVLYLLSGRMPPKPTATAPEDHLQERRAPSPAEDGGPDAESRTPKRHGVAVGSELLS